MNIAMRAHDFETNTLEELTAKCNKYSITHIQLALKKSIKDFQEGEFSPGYAKSIGDELNKSGVKVSVLGCYINPSETNPQRLQKNIDYFVENLYYAKYIGADMVGLETGFVGEKLDVNKNNTEEAYRHLLKTMKILCTEAEHIGVKIGIEGVHCFVINTPQKMKRLIDDLESDNVCVIFDPVNYLNYDNYTNQDNIINDYFNLLSNRTEVIHLKDFKLNNGILSYEYPCNGMLNIDLIIDRLKELNSDIPIILEEVKENNLVEVKNNVINKILNANQ